MDLDDVTKLKFDRRLEHRRDWLEPGEREAFLESLADASSKIHDGSEDEVEEQAAVGETPAPAAPEAPASEAPPSPTPPEGSFGGSSI